MITTQTERTRMFDGIARRYDTLNRVISLGNDQRWRRRAARALELGDNARVLDLACGTGDMAFAALKHAPPSATAVGTDPSREMLKIADRKAAELGFEDRFHTEQGNAEQIRENDGEFDAVTMAFGIRNVEDRRRSFAEMARVLRPGGRLVILELGTPRRGWLAPVARAHIRTVVPRVGRALSSKSAYRYLEDSISKFPAPEELADEIAAAGFDAVSFERLTLDSCHLYSARRARS